jgi:hypothetical protein
MADRGLPPVEENVERPEKLSQSFLARADVCPRSAYLYTKHRGGPQSHAMARGEAFHLFAEWFINLLIDQDENSAPPEVAKDVLAAALAERPDLVLPEAERDALRVMAYHFAENLWIEPSKVVAVEKMLEMELAGTIVRGKVDYATVDPQTRHAEIWDWKSSWAVPSQDDYAKSFQPLLYALMLAEGKGEGDPVPIGRGIDTFKVMEIYPRYRDLPHRETILDRQRLTEFKGDVEALIATATLGFDQGKWSAVPGSHCSTCPAMHECPLPAALIPVPAPDEDPEALAERWFFLSSEAASEKKRLRAIAKESNGPIPLGKDLELRFDLRTYEKLKSGKLPEVKAIIEGAGFDPKDYITPVTESVFDKRKVETA